jgi:phytoene dehydrogenase-like protein
MNGGFPSHTLNSSGKENVMSKSIIIIGAGIAGLSAGCYGQMNGYKTQIFELHDKPGGLCTAWRRKGYTFDGCIHWLVGSKAGTSFNRIWQELGAVQEREFVDHEVYQRIEGTNGQALSIYTNLDRLEQHMKELAPADVNVIEEFCDGARRLTRLGEAMGDFSGPTNLLDGIKMGIKMMPFIGIMRKYSKISAQDFAARFSNPFLRRAFAAAFDMADFPILAVMMMLAWMNKRDAGYPIGASLEFSRAIEHRYLDLGGKIHYRSRVDKIIVENGQAVGIRLADGTEHRADAGNEVSAVISAADGHATIFDMLEGKYANDKVRGYYEKLPIFRSWVQVSLGVARDLSNEPPMVSYPLNDPIDVGGEERKRLSLRHFCYDPTMAPPGKSVVVVMFMSDYNYWKKLYQEREQYDAEKKDVAIKVISRLEKWLPGISEQIEVIDVSTPMTVERYTGNWQGSMEGWLITTETMPMTMGKGMDKTLPGLDNFYMTGQWVEPGGGVPTAANSARRVIGMICKQDKKAFKTSLPTF